MFENNFNYNNQQETISDEIRKLLSSENVQNQITEDCNYLNIWKKKLIELSGDN